MLAQTRVDGAGCTDAERIDLLRALEDLKGAAAAAQAKVTVAPAPPASLGDAALVAEARRIGYRLDPHAVIGRAARAHADRRRVTLRPAPDNMAVLSGLLPPLTASLSTPP